MRLHVGLTLGLIGIAAVARAADQPISGARLELQSGARPKVVFHSNDPSFLFPAIGGPDDPGTGTPGGAVLEILSPLEATAQHSVPKVGGVPGWTATNGAIPTHKFRNVPTAAAVSSIRLALLRQGKVVKIFGRQSGLLLPGPATRIAVRLTIGTQRSCAVFEAATASRNEPGRFLAKHAPAPNIIDCSDASLLGTAPPPCGSTAPTCDGGCPEGESCANDPLGGVCRCVGPNTPCGDSNPTCGGVCPPGETCTASGQPSPLNECGCIPEGATPCGTPGAPTCGGTCESGSSCNPYRSVSGTGCSCTVPDCGTFVYHFGHGTPGSPKYLPPGCYPYFCDGTYPTCGGPCGDGGTCIPFQFQGFTGCMCVP